MIKIVLSAEQASLVCQAADAVEMLDPDGKCLGVFVQAFSAAEIETALKRRDSNQPRYTTAEVLSHLRAIEPH
jgi:hypothetical protein